jgi:hypothetical protein
MNYFGHVALASKFSQSAEFLLGSALPDFASMLGCRAPQCSQAFVTRGVRFHHATDDVFHDLPAFRDLVHAERRTLRALGVRKGPARALAHVGIELLLDAALLGDPIHRTAFRDAVAIASPERVGRRLAWQSIDDPDRFERLRLRLLERQQRSNYDGPAQLAMRLIGTLHGRSRLRLSDSEAATTTTWLHDLQRRLDDSWGPLWRDLITGMSSHWSD